MATSKNLKVRSVLPIEEIVEINQLVFTKRLSVEQFKAFAEAFPNLRMERDKNGKTTIMSPVKFGTGKRELRAGTYLGKWWLENHEIGEIFSASTAIELQDTSIKCPDAGWISEERFALNPVENEDDNFLKVAAHLDIIRKYNIKKINLIN